MRIMEKIRMVWWVLRYYPNCSIIHNCDISPKGIEIENKNNSITCNRVHDFISDTWIGIKVNSK